MTLSYEPMKMTGLINITQETTAAGAALSNCSYGASASFRSTASSSECIESLQSSRRGLRCRLSDASGRSQNFVIGLVSIEAACPQHPQQQLLRKCVDYESISYGAHITHWGAFYVYESGKKIWDDFGTVQAGDVINIRLTREELPKIEYCVNGKVRHTSSEGPPKQARLFGKVCAHYQSPLVEDLQWILEKDPATQIAELQTSITEQQTCISEQQTRITELQTRVSEQQEQLQRLQEENSALRAASRAATNEKQELQDQTRHLREENSALRDQTEQLQEQMEDRLQAASRAATDEKQELQDQLQRLQEEISALHAASRAATDEKQELQVQQQPQPANAVLSTGGNEMTQMQTRTLSLPTEIQSWNEACQTLIRDNVRLQVELQNMQAQMEALRRLRGA